MESESAFLSGGLSDIFPASASEFVTLEQYVAPQISKAGSTSVDATFVALALDGHDADHIARIVGDRAAELTVRLVELRTGPLGCIRPAASEPLLHLFADVKLCRSRLHVPEKKLPVLSLVAQAFGHRLQRLGDRLYLAGQEATLSSLVRQARKKGVRIRFPQIDPMEGAWNTGPSHQGPCSSAASRVGPPEWLQCPPAAKGAIAKERPLVVPVQRSATSRALSALLLSGRLRKPRRS